MKQFVQTAAAHLAAENERPEKRAWGNSPNPYVDPSAIEPITGFLPTFSPVAGDAMNGTFFAQYALIAWVMALEKSENKRMGSMDVNFDNGRYRTLETRDGTDNTPACSIKTSVQLGKNNTASQWTLESQVEDREHVRFIEEGVWDGKTATVKAKSFSRQYATANPLIHRWALLPLLASGSIKEAPLVFDMLDDSALRPNQALRYEGEIEIPVKGEMAKLDSYAQTGDGILPIHYLVDDKGQVQLITMATINWVLTGR